MKRRKSILFVYFFYDEIKHADVSGMFVSCYLSEIENTHTLTTLFECRETPHSTYAHTYSKRTYASKNVETHIFISLTGNEHLTILNAH